MRKEMQTINKQLKMISNSFEEKRNRHLHQYNLTSAQMDVLFYLKYTDKDVTNQREIENWFGMKNPTVTGILNRLEEKGFIVRRKNEADKRYRLIELTDKSRHMLEEISEEIWQQDERLYSCMTEEEQKQLCGLLERILRNLSEDNE
jgi:DNA-binding MarR family transcriptional regulator